MSFDTLKALGKRQAFTVLEIMLDKNDPALDSEFALQPDSYGTPKTTDDIRAYTGTDFRTYRYSDQQLFGVDHFPGLISASSSPPKIDPGGSIGFRATASATVKDFISNDTYELPSAYSDRRISGSHFLKLLARNHVKNRRARIIKGFDPFNYNESNTQIESYLIDNISQPSEGGQVTIKMVDELILVEDSKAKIPEVSKGFLTADVSLIDTTLTFSSPITDEYGSVSSTGYCAIEKEIMFYTVDSSTEMTIAREQFGTSVATHASGETIQKCIAFDNVNIIDIIETLINDYTDIPSSYIPSADWAILKSGDLSLYNLTNCIFKQTTVKKLLNELVMLSGISIYVDVILNQLTIVSVPDFASPVISLNETEHLIQGTVKASLDYKRQITRQSIFWDKSDLSEGDDEKNYRKKFQVIDGVVEQKADVGVISEPKPLKSNWLVNSSEDNQLATSFCQRQVNRFSKIPWLVSFNLDQRYIGNVTDGAMWLGSIFSINTSKIVNGALSNVETTCQCISVKKGSRNEGWNVTGLSYTAAAPISADLFIDVDKIDYLLTDELTTDEAREYTVVIGSGVTIGSSSTAINAFSQGAFFTGATLKLVILGRVVGMGGAGGDGGNEGAPGPSCTVQSGSSGLDGGDCINLTTDTIIDNGFGLILSGGGGGSGGNSVCWEDQGGSFFSHDGGGGGGGQGYSSSDGGTGGPSSEGDGFNGSLSAPGEGAPDDPDSGGGGGYIGGAFGSDGGGGGGAAGAAIKSNGNTVTITAGNNSEQIKGAVT